MMMAMAMEPKGRETTDGGVLGGGWGLVMSCGCGGRRRSGTQEAAGDSDLRDVRRSSSSPLCSSISTLPARLREYRSTLSRGFSRSCEAGKEGREDWMEKWRKMFAGKKKYSEG